MNRTRVVIVGASGTTGYAIAKALVASPGHFEVTALARQESLDKPELTELAKLGATVRPIDLDGSVESVSEALVGVDVVISALTLRGQKQEKTLAAAAKKVNVARFVPSFFGPICPPRGVMVLREMKEDMLDYIKSIYLPYTAIDVGWWYQMVVASSLSKGHVTSTPIIGAGSVPAALTDARDIGKFVCRIITDTRTLNRSVFAYSAIHSLSEAYSMYEKTTSKSLEKPKISDDEIIAISAEKHALGSPEFFDVAIAQYRLVNFVRGDNAPDKARYLGYLDAKELYPDLECCTLSQYFLDLKEEEATSATAV